MEDFISITTADHYHLFSVFDGHGGKVVAFFLSRPQVLFTFFTRGRRNF